LKEFKLVEKKSSTITNKDIESISNNFGFLDKVSRFKIQVFALETKFSHISLFLTTQVSMKNLEIKLKRVK
jgi:hypothetical protein